MRLLERGSVELIGPVASEASRAPYAIGAGSNRRAAVFCLETDAMIRFNSDWHEPQLVPAFVCFPSAKHRYSLL